MSFARLVAPSVNVYAVCPVRSARAVSIATSVSTPYFVLGDNRNNSEDSRYANIGNVKKEYIIGKAWFRFSGISDFGMIK